jgi:hypothetical protein
MAQIRATIGSRKKAKIAKIIHKKRREARILLIFFSKNKPRITRSMIISPFVKK